MMLMLEEKQRSRWFPMAPVAGGPRKAVHLPMAVLLVCGFGASARADEDVNDYRIAFTVPAEQRVLMQRPLPAIAGPKSLIEQVGTFLNHPVANPNSGNPGILGETLPPLQRYWARFKRSQYQAAVQVPAVLGSEVPGVSKPAAADPCKLHNPTAHTAAQSWDNAYELIANYGACSNAHILESENYPVTPTLYVIEPRIATPDKKAIPPPVHPATVAWPWPGHAFWHRDPNYTGLDAALTTMQ
jgi:hypothetical protein